MTGTIRRRRPNVWELTVDVGKDPNGKRRRCSATFLGTKPEAERRLRQMVDDAERRRYQISAAAGETILVCDWLRSWLKEFVLRHHSVTTYERYMSIAEKQVIPHIATSNCEIWRHGRSVQWTNTCSTMVCRRGRWESCIPCYPEPASMQCSWN